MEILNQFAPLILIVVIFYFFILRPQWKASKKEKNFLKELKRGDKIVTKSGIHAKINDVSSKDESCIIETMAGKLKVEKSAISIDMSQKLNK
jgi:preprotein translocase subunit YajC